MKTNLRPLVEKNLLYAGLVPLSPTLVGRYNDALVSMGLEPTALKRIEIDGAGWSPQVAKEKKNLYYLCVGGIINPTAIIITPEQYKKPVYFPVFSWMRRLMRQVFDKYHREIFDITSTNAISLDLEDWISTLESPADLLLMSEIRAIPQTGGLAEFAAAQKALVANCMEGNNFIDDPALRNQLIENRKAHGDLRSRRLDMKPVSFDLFNDFHTVAYGGVTVLRSVGKKDMLVIQDHGQFQALEKLSIPDARACYLFDKAYEPFHLLREAGMIAIPTARFRVQPELLEEKKDLLISFALCDCEEHIDWHSLASAKQKSLLGKHAEKIPAIFEELERYAAILRRGAPEPLLSDELTLFLLEPADTMPPDTQEVLWALLTKRDPRNLLSLYTHDKNFFLTQYEGWSVQKQRWAADYIAARYVPRMSQP